MSSTELFDAASISTTSSDDADAIALHDSQTPHGVIVGPPLAAVQRRRQDLRHRRLPGPARADEQVRVVHATLRDRVAQRADDVLLPDDVCERAGAMTAVQRSGQGSVESSDATSGLALRAALRIPLGALLAWALVGAGFLNYDTAYSLLWGGDLAHGRTPDFSVPLAPTPHPLATLTGIVLTPFGDAAPADLGRARVPGARRARLAELRARRALVRAGGRRGGGAGDPDPDPGPELRRARVRRHPVRGARARSDPGRGAPAAHHAAADPARAWPGCCGRRRGCSRSPTSSGGGISGCSRWPPPRRSCGWCTTRSSPATGTTR